MALRLMSFLTLVIFASCTSTTELLPLPMFLEIVSQEDVEKYKDQLQEIEVFEGNITIGLRSMGFGLRDGEKPISDLSFLDNIVEVTGNFVIGGDIGMEEIEFATLTRVGGAVGVFVTKANSVSFTNLESVNNITVTSCDNLLEIEFPALCEVNSLATGIDISRNPMLKKIGSLGKVDTLSVIQISGNKSLSNFGGFQNLKVVSRSFLFDISHPLELTDGALSEISTIKQLDFQSVDATMDFNWIENIKEAESLSFLGDIEIDDLCPIKEFVINNPGVFSFSSLTTGSIFDDEDILAICL